MINYTMAAASAHFSVEMHCEACGDACTEILRKMNGEYYRGVELCALPSVKFYE